METEKIRQKTFFITFAAIVFIEVASTILISGSCFNEMIIMGIVRVLETMFIILIVIILEKGPDSIGLGPSTIFSGFKKGLIWSAIFGLVSFFIFFLLYSTGINPLKIIDIQLPDKTYYIILYFLVGAIVGPVAEEIFFRGIIYGFFRRWGMLTALILSTAMFIICHHNFYQSIPVTQIVGGLTFTIAYEIEASLMVPITIHILGNMAIFTLSFI